MSLWTKVLIKHLHKPISITRLLEITVPALHVKNQRPWMVVTPGKAYSLAMCASHLLVRLQNQDSPYFAFWGIPWRRASLVPRGM